MKKKYLVRITGEVEVEAESEDEAQTLAYTNFDMPYFEIVRIKNNKEVGE